MTPARMWPWSAQVLQRRRVRAACLFESVSEERQLVPAASVVNDRGQFHQRTVVAGEHGRVRGEGADWVANNVADQVANRPRGATLVTAQPIAAEYPSDSFTGRDQGRRPPFR